MSRGAELAARSLDLVARNVDLVSTLLEASSTSGGLLNRGIQLGEWLAHEKLNRHELRDCFVNAHGLAWPNRNGEMFQIEVKRKPAIMPILPLFLQVSGSLGRLLVFDEALCWIVSTTGCLLRYHKEQVVTTAIVTIILESRAKKASSNVPIYDFGKVQIMSVVKKIVSSVWFNVVNAGTETMGLPDALTNVCAVGHNLPPEHLGRLVVALQQQRPHVVIRCPRMYQNLALWLLLHFHGHFVVTVSGKVVLREDLGRTSAESRDLELRIQVFCHPNSGNIRECVHLEHEHIEILENVAGEFESFFDSKAPGISDQLLSDAQIRQELYNPKPIRGSGRPGLPESSKIWARCTAQEMTKWLLGLSVSAAEDIEGFGFYVDLDPGVSSKELGRALKIADVLKRMPGILNKKWGDRPPSTLVFANRVEEETGNDSVSSEAELEGPHTASPLATNQGERQRTGFEILLSYFPILRELTQNVRGQCRCTEYQRQKIDNGMETSFKEGCFQHLALSEVLCLLSHAIADAFGVDDTSARRDTESLVEGMTTLLHLLVEEKVMPWDAWFCVAGSVLLGCPVKSHPTKDIEQGTSVCALQYGSLAAVAGWLDLNKELRVHNSFSLVYGEGKLGTIYKDDDNNNQFRGLASDYAIIQTDMTEDTTSYTERTPMTPWHHSSTMQNVHDSSKAKSDYILVPLDQEVYRLLTRVQSNTHSRIVDPVQAMKQTARGSPIPPGPSHANRHENEHRDHDPSAPDTVTSYSFDEVLGRWPEPGPPNVLVSRTLDTNLKLNVAHALSGTARAISYSETTCLKCMILKLGKGSSRSEEPMYIINSVSNPSGFDRIVGATTPVGLLDGSGL